MIYRAFICLLFFNFSLIFGQTDSLVSVEPKVLNLEEVLSKMNYPSKAQKKQIKGTVIVRICIDEIANYEKHFILKSPHPLLTKEVEKHVKEFRFSQAIDRGVPIKCCLTIPVDFRLNSFIDEYFKSKN